MTDLNVNFEDMDKTISLGGENIKDTGIQLTTSNLEKDDLMLGVELLANQSIDKPNDKGYSSGDDNAPKTPKGDPQRHPFNYARAFNNKLLICNYYLILQKT